MNQFLGGWEISNMLMARSGLPISITTNHAAGYFTCCQMSS